MAISRKQALRRLEGLARAATNHLEEHIPSLIDDYPESIPHWREELNAWIGEMRRLTKHVGKRTAQHWNVRIDEWQSSANALLGNE